MLTLVGMGLFDEQDITLRGLEAAKNADKVYIELYTGKWGGSLDKLSKMIGNPIVELARKDLEENSSAILKEAKNDDIIIFVQGDPLIVTTHSALLMDAKKQGIAIKVIHNASIVSAIAETGLHIQKFGPLVSIPFSEKTKGKLPQSVYDVIKHNQESNLHTLCLLDIVAEEKRYLTVNETLNILLKLEKQNGDGLIENGSKLVVFSVDRSSKIFYGTLKELLDKTFNTPTVIIIPAKLHFTEKEYLESYKI